MASVASGSPADRLSWAALAFAAVVGGFATARAFPPADWLDWIASVVALPVAILAGAADLRTRRVPNALTLPLMAFALVIAGARIVEGVWGFAQLGGIAFIWGVCLAAWIFKLVGGGDSKLAMGLLAFFPNASGILAVLLGLLIGGVVYLQWGPRRGGVSRLMRVALEVLARRAPPTTAEIEDAYRGRSDPAAAWLAVGFCAYLALGAFPLL